MAIKLKLVSRIPQLRLALKALIFGLLLLLVKTSGFGLLPVILFLTVAGVFYAQPLFKTIELLTIFFILLTTALLVVKAFLYSSYAPLAILYFTTLFYLLLGVKNLVLIQREKWQRFLNLALSYNIFLLFFFYSQNDFFSRLLPALLGLFLLLRSLFRKRLIIWITILLMAETLWAISLLPIGFINAASLAFLVYFDISDLAGRHLNQTLNRRRILTDVTILIVLLVAIFAFSRWSL